MKGAAADLCLYGARNSFSGQQTEITDERAIIRRCFMFYDSIYDLMMADVLPQTFQPALKFWSDV